MAYFSRLAWNHLLQKGETSFRPSDVNLVTTHAHSDVRGCTSGLMWVWVTSSVHSFIRNQRISSSSLFIEQRASSPGVFNQHRLDEVDSQGGDSFKRVLRVVYVDLGDVEECLLLLVTKERRLARQHDVGQDPDTPDRREEEREWGNLSFLMVEECELRHFVAQQMWQTSTFSWSKTYLIL